MTAAAARAQGALEAFLDELHPGWDDAPVVVERARALSVTFTSDRRARATPTLDAVGRAAYLAYFGPRTIAALSSTLDATTPLAPHVVDIGAGTGASALTLAAAGARTLTLVDHDPGALALAARLVAHLDPAVRVDTVRGGPEAAPPASDVVLSFALSELVAGDGGQDDALFARLVARARARLIVVDGGDRAAARAVQHLRAHALAHALHVAHPCPHEDVCPALARASDWCHQRVARHLTPRFAALAQAVGRDEALMAKSSLVVTHAAAPPRPEDALLVIGAPHVEKGRVRVGVCGPGGLRALQVLRRHADTADAVAALPRGALVVVDGERRGDVVHASAPPRVVDTP